MPSLPRIITVDPASTVAEQVRGALLLLDRLAIQIDVPSANDALEELKYGKYNAVIAAWEPGDNMRGWELAAKIKKISEDTPILILADYEDTELDPDTLKESPFFYMKRPFDVPQFLRVVTAILDAKDIGEAMMAPATEAMGAATPQFGGVPDMSADKAKPIVQQFMIDTGAMAALLTSRDGKVLVEQGTVGYLKREEIANALIPATVSHLSMREKLNGNATLFQLYDGETYDLYVLSVGFHHLLVLIFDGQNGSRAIGAVRGAARRATEDLIGLMGANAWLMHAQVIAVPEEQEVRHRVRTRVSNKDEEPVALAVANLVVEEETPKDSTQEAPVVQLEAIENLDLDFLFASDMADADNLFNLDSMEQELAKLEDKSTGGKLDWDKAKELGLLGGE